MPPRPDVAASYAIPVRRARTLLTASFRFRVAPDTLAVRLTVPTIRVRRGLAPPSHRPDTTPAKRASRHPRHSRTAALVRTGSCRIMWWVALGIMTVFEPRTVAARVHRTIGSKPGVFSPPMNERGHGDRFSIFTRERLPLLVDLPKQRSRVVAIFLLIGRSDLFPGTAPPAPSKNTFRPPSKSPTAIFSAAAATRPVPVGAVLVSAIASDESSSPPGSARINCEAGRAAAAPRGTRYDRRASGP